MDLVRTSGNMGNIIPFSYIYFHKFRGTGAMSDNLIGIAENNINAGQYDNLKALLREMMDSIQRDEPGTLNYEWFIAEDGKSVDAFERYVDSGACMVHLGNLGPKYGERLVACVTATK